MRKIPRVAKVRLVPKPEVARYPTALHNLAERLDNGVHFGSSDVSPAIRQPLRVDDLAGRMPPSPIRAVSNTAGPKAVMTFTKNLSSGLTEVASPVKELPLLS